jgi:alanine racemase
LYGDYSSALEQRELFLRQQRVCKSYFPNLCCHLSATSGSLYGEDFAFDMTRVGLGLYGYLPPKLEEEARKVGETLDLKKAMRIYGKVLFSRRVSFGGLGYGNSLDEEKLKKKEKVSLLRFGYADGFLRTKRNGVEGYAKNANNLCMDASIQWGEKKRGKQVPLMLNADQTAEIAGTISYEVLCAATRRAEFIYED